MPNIIPFDIKERAEKIIKHQIPIYGKEGINDQTRRELELAVQMGLIAEGEVEKAENIFLSWVSMEIMEGLEQEGFQPIRYQKGNIAKFLAYGLNNKLYTPKQTKLAREALRLLDLKTLEAKVL